MKVTTVIWSGASAMLATSMAVYFLTPVEPHALATELPAPAVAQEVEAPVAEEPAGSLAVEARVGHGALSAQGERRTYLMLEVRGSEAPPGTAAIETSTALVIDTSGSMVGARLEQARAAARRWIQRAPDKEVISVVGFADQAHAVVPPTVLDAATRNTAIGALDAMAAAGDTCLSCGVQQALTSLAATDRIQRVVLLSDGQANRGIKDVAGIRALASTCRDQGVAVSTIGLGIGYNEKMLAALAFDSNGLHHFVASTDDLPAVFQKEEQNLRGTVAGGVSADIELAPGVEVVQMFARKYEQSGRRLHVDLGAIAAGDTRTVLLEVRVPGVPGETPLASVAVGYRDVVAGMQRTAKRSLATKVGNEQGELDALVEMRLERARTSAALGAAADLFSQGKRDEAFKVLDDQLAGLESRATSVTRRAQAAGDHRAADIEGDYARQQKTAQEARNDFGKAKPKAESGEQAKRKATWAADPYDR